MNLDGLVNKAHSNIVVIALLATAILWAPAPSTSGRASSITDEWDEVSETARAVLARMPDANTIDSIKEPGLREAVRRANRALKECSKVNKGQSRAVKQAAVADFERAFKSVQEEAERSEYQTCASKCNDDGAACEKDCASARKKLCACKMTKFGCVVKCVVG